MPFENVEKVIEFVKRSHLQVVNVMGGEPTLHPEFSRIIDRFLEAELEVRIFTGGLISEKSLKYLKTLNTEKVVVGVNIPAPAESLTQKQHKRIHETLRQLCDLATLAFTVYQPQLNLRFLVDLVFKFGTRRSIRLGIGVPAINSKETVTLTPIQYRSVVPQIMDLSRQCHKHSISLTFDCGFTRCMFSNKELELLHSWGIGTVFACSPIVDIGPDLSVWSCFPLFTLCRSNLQDFSTRDELVKYFWIRQRAYRNLGVYDECLSCQYKQHGQCAGGCLAHVIRSFQLTFPVTDTKQLAL